MSGLGPEDGTVWDQSRYGSGSYLMVSVQIHYHCDKQICTFQWYYKSVHSREKTQAESRQTGSEQKQSLRAENGPGYRGRDEAWRAKLNSPSTSTLARLKWSRQWETWSTFMEKSIMEKSFTEEAGARPAHLHIPRIAMAVTDGPTCWQHVGGSGPASYRCKCSVQTILVSCSISGFVLSYLHGVLWQLSD